MKKKLNKVLKFVEKKVKEAEMAPFQILGKFVNHNWRPARGVLEYPGVYIIYREKRKRSLYIGSAGKESIISNTGLPTCSITETATETASGNSSIRLPKIFSIS